MSRTVFPLSGQPSPRHPPRPHPHNQAACLEPLRRCPQPPLHRPLGPPIWEPHPFAAGAPLTISRIASLLSASRRVSGASNPWLRGAAAPAAAVQVRRCPVDRQHRRQPYDRRICRKVPAEGCAAQDLVQIQRPVASRVAQRSVGALQIFQVLRVSANFAPDPAKGSPMQIRGLWPSRRQVRAYARARTHALRVTLILARCDLARPQ